MNEVLEWFKCRDFLELSDEEFFWKMAFDKSFSIEVLPEN